MKKKFITFGAPLIQKKEILEVVDSLKSGWLGTGPKVSQFEKNFSKYKKAPYSIAVNSCSAALHLSLLSLNLKKEDEVITTPLTFCSTINAIIHAGLNPVLADIDPLTLNIDPKEIEKKINKKTKCILVVHFAGLPCDMDNIIKIAKKFNLKVVEDCAHAIESKYKGKHSGTFGDLGCFSFYSYKNLVTGEGGMVVSKNKLYADRIKKLALHGMSKDAWQRFTDKGYKHYFIEKAGFKYNMMDIQASLGIHQLKRINKNWKKRKQIWDRYNREFDSLSITKKNKIHYKTKHAYHLYNIFINKNKLGISRDQFINLMQKNNIGVGVHYRSIPEHQFYRYRYGWKLKDYPNAYKVGSETISLPISPKLTLREIDKIIRVVKKIIK